MRVFFEWLFDACRLDEPRDKHLVKEPYSLETKRWFYAREPTELFGMLIWKDPGFFGIRAGRLWFYVKDTRKIWISFSERYGHRGRKIGRFIVHLSFKPVRPITPYMLGEQNVSSQ